MNTDDRPIINTRFVLRSSTASFLEEWDNDGRVTYTDRVDHAMRFPTSRSARNFLIKRTYRAGQMGTQYNSDFHVVAIKPTQTWEVVS